MSSDVAGPADASPADPTPRSRRALLAAALGGVVGSIATSLGRPLPTDAAAGDSLKLGQTNFAGGSATRLNTTSSGGAFWMTQYGFGSAIKGDSINGHGAVVTTAHQDRDALHGQQLASTHGVGAAVRGDGGANDGVVGTSTGTGSYGVRGSSPFEGVYGETTGDSGAGVHGFSQGIAPGVLGFAAHTGVIGQGSDVGVRGDGSLNGIGVVAVSGGGTAVVATSSSEAGIRATSTSYHGVIGTSTNQIGVYGTSSLNSGVHGVSTSGAGVSATSTNSWGMEASSASHPAVYGLSTSSNGVLGATSSYIGVEGTSSTGTGVQGSSAGSDGHGVVGSASADSGNAAGIYGGADFTSAYAGYFAGKVAVTGALSKGGGSFKIDHPLDPERKFLMHSFVESPDMKNVYDGVVTTDGSGRAVVELPDWFDALNGDVRYQLTTIRSFARAMVSAEVAKNRFEITTDAPGVRVSWQVTGIRRDAWAQANRIPIELDKAADERGRYLHPIEHGQPASKGLDHLMRERIAGSRLKLPTRP
jgi:hypothetical protein